MKPLLLLLFVLFITKANAQLTGRTTGPLPYLEYGTGDDRLGGAKMTYLDSGIKITVVDSLLADYKVLLSKNHFAWLPKANFVADDSIKNQPHYLSSSWRVWGGGKYDYVSLALTEKLPYNSMQQICPAKIVVDVFGVTSNTNWITQLKTVKEIKNVWYEQLEDDVLRVHVQLTHQQHWGYAIFYRNNSLQIKIKQQPEKLKVKNLKIAIDAGHGGANTGATGLVTKIKEKDYTLKIARQLQKILEKKGATVFMTRTEDVDISMVERTILLKNEEPDLLISIHLNSAGNKEVKGVSTYYRHIGFRPLTQYILDRMLQLELNNFGNIGAFNFSLSGPTQYPNCLVEVAFLSNSEDEQKILNENFQKDVAKKIYEGISDWLRGMR